jgi:predicted transcriptional regulator
MDQKGKLDAMVRARVRPEYKRRLEAIAQAREMDVSDVIREALRFYLFHQTVPAAPIAAAARLEELADV